MKIRSYHHREGEDLQFLYSDGEFDQSRIPAKIIDGRKGHDCCETVITEFAPKVTWEESEGQL